MKYWPEGVRYKWDWKRFGFDRKQQNKTKQNKTIEIHFSEAQAANNERGGQAEFGMREVHIILEKVSFG